jgi:hypothetical protein
MLLAIIIASLRDFKSDLQSSEQLWSGDEPAAAHGFSRSLADEFGQIEVAKRVTASVYFYQTLYPSLCYF